SSNALTGSSIPLELPVAIAVEVHVAERLLGHGSPLQEEADVELVGHADAAVHLNALARHPIERLPDLGLRQARELRDLLGAAAFVERGQRLEHTRFRQLHLAEHVGSTMLERLERANRYTELLALLQILD